MKRGRWEDSNRCVAPPCGHNASISKVKRRVKRKMASVHTLSLSYTISRGLPFIDERRWQTQWSAFSVLFCFLPLTKHRNLSSCFATERKSAPGCHNMSGWETLKFWHTLHVFKPGDVITIITECNVVIQKTKHVGMYLMSYMFTVINSVYYYTWRKIYKPYLRQNTLVLHQSSMII